MKQSLFLESMSGSFEVIERGNECIQIVTRGEKVHLHLEQLKL